MSVSGFSQIGCEVTQAVASETTAAQIICCTTTKYPSFGALYGEKAFYQGTWAEETERKLQTKLKRQ
jgi:hypothetical protein